MRLSTSIFGLLVTTTGVLTILFSLGYKFDTRISLVVILLAFALLIAISAVVKRHRDSKVESAAQDPELEHDQAAQQTTHDVPATAAMPATTATPTAQDSAGDHGFAHTDVLGTTDVVGSTDVLDSTDVIDSTGEQNTEKLN